MKKTVSCCLALLLCLLLFAGCTQMRGIVSGVTNPGEYPVEVAGVTINARPGKVAALSPALADVVLALGDETQLAAVSTDCAVGGLETLPRVNAVDAQAVAALSPDLVLLSAGQEEAAQALTEAGLTVLVLAPATDREDFERLYGEVSSALAGGGPGYDAGVSAAQGIFTTLDDISRIVPKERVVTACYLRDLESAGVTGDELASTVMSYAGVTNIFRSLTGGVYTYDALRVSNPDVIFCAPGLKEPMKSDSRFQELQAVQNDRVYELEEDLVRLQGRTVVTLAYEISAATFPELLEEGNSSATDPIDEINSQVSEELATPSPEPTPETTYTTLTREDDSDEVLQMQERLAALGYLDGEYDGYFGEATENSLKAFQTANGLSASGVADNETLRKLYAEDAVPAPTDEE